MTESRCGGIKKAQSSQLVPKEHAAVVILGKKRRRKKYILTLPRESCAHVSSPRNLTAGSLLGFICPPSLLSLSVLRSRLLTPPSLSFFSNPWTLLIPHSSLSANLSQALRWIGSASYFGYNRDRGSRREKCWSERESEGERECV